jgi:hypothetical protein
MKRVMSTIGVFMLGSVLSGAAQAQVGTPAQEEKYFRIPHKYHLYIDLSGAIPNEPGLFNDFWNSSFHVGLGGGVTLFPWLDVNGNFTYTTWPNNSTDSKVKIEYVGVSDVEGGTIKTMTFSGSARFVGIPNARTNPFAEVAVGYYTTSAENITIEPSTTGQVQFPGLTNSMESASGMMVAPMIGLQYAMADSWSAYAKYAYVLCLGDQFAPGDLLEPVGGGEPVPGDTQIYTTIGVGVMLRF